MGDPGLSAAAEGARILARRRWMSVLAQASPAELEAAAADLARPPYRRLRGPEVGLVMVRARAGATGMRFNLGEMTVTRCTIQLDDGTLGHAWIAGRNAANAETAAVLDALLQDADAGPAREREIVAPLAEVQAARRRAVAERAAASRVEFFTMVRGED